MSWQSSDFVFAIQIRRIAVGIVVTLDASGHFSETELADRRKRRDGRVYMGLKSLRRRELLRGRERNALQVDGRSAVFEFCDSCYFVLIAFRLSDRDSKASVSGRHRVVRMEANRENVRRKEVASNGSFQHFAADANSVEI